MAYWTASLSDNPICMEYTTLEPDLDIAGTWMLQAEASSLSPLVEFHGELARLNVDENL